MNVVDKKHGHQAALTIAVQKQVVEQVLLYNAVVDNGIRPTAIDAVELKEILLRISMIVALNGRNLNQELMPAKMIKPELQALELNAQETEMLVELMPLVEKWTNVVLFQIINWQVTKFLHNVAHNIINQMETEMLNIFIFIIILEILCS